ncbi:MAG: CRISPR-associated endoribonuclease Cas6, partial [Promethearchaeota archaeon]
RRYFKYFCFSDVFPPARDDDTGGVVIQFLISSPNADFIKVLKEQLITGKRYKLGGMMVEAINTKLYKIGVRSSFKTGSPVVLYKNNRENLYFSFKRDGDVMFFLDRVKMNALKKFNTYYNAELEFDDAIFDTCVFNKEVAVREFKSGHAFIVIGSMWSLLRANTISRHLYKFYIFIMDCGIGEKNSFGFGFLNPIKER